MKYVIDVDAFVECLDCVDSIKVNGAYYIEVSLLKEFVQRFPKEKISSEYTEYNTESPHPHPCTV